MDIVRLKSDQSNVSTNPAKIRVRKHTKWKSSNIEIIIPNTFPFNQSVL